MSERERYTPWGTLQTNIYTPSQLPTDVVVPMREREGRRERVKS